MSDLDRSRILQLVTAAIRAPSADNRHHVRFAVREDGLQMRATAGFLDNDERHRRLLTLLSFGAIGENLRLALGTLGLDYRPAWFPRPDDPGLLLDLRWDAMARTGTVDPLAARISTRHTNRRFFRGPTLTEVERTELEAAAPLDEARVEWFDAKPCRGALLRLMRLAETARFRNPRLHAELFGSIDFDAGWRRPTLERLAPATLEVEPFLRGSFGLMRHWRVMRLANGLGTHRLLGLRAGDLPARLAPHLGAITSALPPDEAALAVGAAFQRLWLTADRLGLALQPMVAAAILATDDRPDRGIDAATRRRLQDGWRALVGDTLPLVVFRLGRARRPAVVSGRPPAETFVD